MAYIEMVMPRMGESIMEGKILKWLKEEGETIEQEENVLEVATDKVDTEVPASFGGVLHQILAHEGDIVEVGKPIAIIQTEEEVEAGATAAPPTPKPTVEQEPDHQEKQEKEISSDAGNQLEAGYKFGGKIVSRFYSPLVKNIAQRESIPVEELEQIPGTGKKGRVTKRDILNYVKSRSQTASMGTKGFQAESAGNGNMVGVPDPHQKVSESLGANDEIVQMDRMRSMIAQRMSESLKISAHVTSFVEADVTEIVQWRQKMKYIFKEQENVNLTLTPIFIEAVVKALKDYPMVNVSVEGDKIIKHGDINMGMAVALPNSNLIVPVIKNADRMSIVGLVRKVNELAKKARNNELKADDLSGGTYTVSNMGSFGNVMGTPIIMQPQVAILAFGTVEKKPAVVETPQGDAIVIRHKMFLSHSYDHRVIDGSLGGMFVRRVADYLEKFDPNRRI